MKTKDDSTRTNILLSLQRALLGAVTPNLRGVAVDWNEKEIRIVFYFDGSISDEDREEMSCVDTEVVADFVDIAPVDFVLEQVFAICLTCQSDSHEVAIAAISAHAHVDWRN